MVTAFTLFELLRENQQRERIKLPPTPTQIMLKFGWKVNKYV